MSDGQSYAEKALAKGSEAVLRGIEERGPDWLTKAIDKAEGKALDLFSEDDPRRLVAVKAFEPLREESFRTALSRQGRDRAERLLLRLGVGDDVDAALAAFQSADGLTFAERRALSHAAVDEARSRTEQREADSEAIRATLLAVGQVALKLAVPLLLAAL